MAAPVQTPDTFTPDEARALAPYFTNTDRPVFALTNLPETVKGALFARYSRSAKSVRRLFLDEFIGEVQTGSSDSSVDRGDKTSAGPTAAGGVGTARAEKLYARVLSEYGDDSVAQLGGAHLACEGVSNVLTKVLEWGRLMAYLEQSTRYVPYTDRPDGRWKYHVPAELDGSPLREAFVRTLDRAFETYARWIPDARGALPREVSEGAGGLRRRLSLGDSRQGARHASRPAAGGDDIQRRPVRHGPGVRSAAAAHVRASARGSARLRRADARRAAAGDSRVSRAGRSARIAAADGSNISPETRHAFDSADAAGRRPTSRPSRGRGHAHRFRSGRRNESRRRGAVFRIGSSRRPAAGDCPAPVRRRSRGAAPRLRRRARATAGTSPAARSSGRAIVSTCSPTTARSAICSATDC